MKTAKTEGKTETAASGLEPTKRLLDPLERA
jgi:hypothetical protein